MYVGLCVYNGPGENTAWRVLQSLTKHGQRIPVIVLVDRSDFDQYYSLMCERAYDYFDLAADPGGIERVLRGATQAAA